MRVSSRTDRHLDRHLEALLREGRDPRRGLSTGLGKGDQRPGTAALEQRRCSHLGQRGERDVSAQHRGREVGVALELDLIQADAGHSREHGRRHEAHRALALVTEADPGRGLGRAHQIRQVFPGGVGPNHQHLRRHLPGDDRRQILDLVGDRLDQRRGREGALVEVADRVSVGWRCRQRGAGDGLGCARPGRDDKRLVQRLGECLGHLTNRQVRLATGSESVQEGDRFRGIVLGSGKAAGQASEGDDEHTGKARGRELMHGDPRSENDHLLRGGLCRLAPI